VSKLESCSRSVQLRGEVDRVESCREPDERGKGKGEKGARYTVYGIGASQELAEMLREHASCRLGQRWPAGAAGKRVSRRDCNCGAPGQDCETRLPGLIVFGYRRGASWGD
jgi:hypothetical protein